MDAQVKLKARSAILTWIGGAIFFIGFLFFPLSFIVAIGGFFSEEGGFLTGIMSFLDVWGVAIGVCGFGLAVSRGKRWHLFALLLIIFFGSFLIGLFSMVGKETNIGYYIWAIGGGFSLFLLLFMYFYWDEFLDG